MAAVGTLTPDTGASTQGSTKFNMSIINEATQSVQFLLRPKSGEWKTYVLGPGEKGIYSCLDCSGVFEISIKTDGKVVTYQIKTGILYGIRVNEARDIYDVYTIP